MTRRRAQAALLALALAGCKAQHAGRLPFVARSAQGIGFEVLSTRAVGEHCTYHFMGVPQRVASYGRALALALESTPGANALRNVRTFYVCREWIIASKTCYWVVGEAGKLQ